MTAMGLIFEATKESLHVITVIVASVYTVLCVLIILTLTAALAKIGAGQLTLSMTALKLKGHLSCWFQLVIRRLLVAILQDPTEA